MDWVLSWQLARYYSARQRTEATAGPMLDLQHWSAFFNMVSSMNELAMHGFHTLAL